MKGLQTNRQWLVVLVGVVAGLTDCSVKPPPQERFTTDTYEIVDEYSGTEAGRYNNRGGIRFAEGDLRGAIEDFREAVKLDPKESSYYENLGWALSTRGEHMEAFWNVDVAIRLRSKDAEVYWKRGVINGRLGRYRWAVDDFTTALTINPELPRPMATEERQKRFYKIGRVRSRMPPMRSSWIQPTQRPIGNAGWPNST